MTTREDIDRALVFYGKFYLDHDPATCIDPTDEAHMERVGRDRILVEAARRGRLLFPSICQTCGGSGEDIQQSGTRAFTIPCPSCGGSGKEWPREVIQAMEEASHLYLAPWQAVPILDALAALAEEDHSISLPPSISPDDDLFVMGVPEGGRSEIRRRMLELAKEEAEEEE